MPGFRLLLAVDFIILSVHSAHSVCINCDSLKYQHYEEASFVLVQMMPQLNYKYLISDAYLS
jgi:hypothetical protein